MPRQIMIADLQFKIQYDRRGKISAGRLTDEGAMQKLDYFDVSDFPELVEMYGDKPKALTVFLPTNNPLDFLGYRWERWASRAGKSVMVRFCDRESCVHRVQEVVKDKTYVAGQETPCICKDLNENVKEEKDKMCKRHCWLKAYVVHPESYAHRNSLAYWFDNHSKNSAENVLSEIYKTLARNYGILQNVPFEISVVVVQDQLDAKKNFPVWNMRALGSVEALQQQTKQMLKEAAVEQGPFARSLLQLGTGTAEIPQATEEKPEPEATDQELYPTFVADIRSASSVEQLSAVAGRMSAVRERLTQEHRDTLSQMYDIRKADLEAEKGQSL